MSFTLFVSRALGVLASLCWDRPGFAIERPKSVTTDWVNDFIKNCDSATRI